MKITLKEISVRNLVKGYKDSGENGVVALNGNLDVRPPYQREFVYKDEQQREVIDTILNNCPLGVMYWAKKDGETYEIIDGQQRALSICKYFANDFSYNERFFENLYDNEQDAFLDYKIQVYICDGDNSEKLAWFKKINIAGEKLTDQELRNATYYGSWVTDAKRYFSRPNLAADKLAKDYINANCIRQGILELAIKWDCKSSKDEDIRVYMASHQKDENASVLWASFQKVIAWVSATFPVKRPIMKSVDWGFLYEKYKNENFDTDKLEAELKELLEDDDVTSKSGAYYYVFDHDEKHLSIRAFDKKQKITVYEKQNGLCAKCQKHFEIDEMEADHIKPYSEGGRTVIENCQMLCKDCNRRKSDK